MALSTSAKIGIVVAVVVVAAAIVGIMFLMPGGQAPTPAEGAGERELIIYGGEISVNKYGYGFSPDELTSPGPDIVLKVGEKTKITFKNVGNLPHTLAISNEKRFDATPLFGVQIGTPTSPIGPDGERSVSIIPKQAGEFLYICQVPGHIELGMWGKVIIQG